MIDGRENRTSASRACIEDLIVAVPELRRCWTRADASRLADAGARSSGGLRRNAEARMRGYVRSTYRMPNHHVRDV